MVFRPSVKKFLWALIYAALPNADCHLHDVITGMDVSSGGIVMILSRDDILSSYDAGLTWKLLARPHHSYHNYDTQVNRNEIIMSPAFDEDGVVIYGGKYLSEDGGANWEAIKTSKRGRLKNIKDSCAQTHKDGMAFHPHYNHQFLEDRRKMVMMATVPKNVKPEIWVSDDTNRKLKKLNLSWPIKKAFTRGECPMLATMGNVTYLATQSMDIFGTVDFGESWSVVLRAQANGEVLMQLQVDQTSAQAGQEADTLLLVTRNRVYQVQPRMKTQFPLQFSTPPPVRIMFPDSSPNHPINLVATHRGPGKESSTFISRTQCPTPTECQDTRNDNVLTSHDITEHTWSTSEIKDWFGLDRSKGEQPASHFTQPEFTDIKGVTGTPQVYIGTYSGIYRSDDGGDSWLELDTIANSVTTLSISPAPVDGGSFARVTACTYMGGCFWGEVHLNSLGNEEPLHVGDMVPQICNYEPRHMDPNPCPFVRYNVAVDSPTFDIDHISLRSLGDKFHQVYMHTQIERSTDDFATVTIQLETKIDADMCKLTGKCSPPIAALRVIKFSPNFKEDKTVYTAGIQGLWRSTDNGLTFERLSGIPRAGLGERCTRCNMVTTGWTGRDIVSLSFSPTFAKDDTMVALSQTSYSSADKTKRYISVSTDGGVTWTDMVEKNWVPDHRQWTSAVITAGPDSSVGLTVVATQFEERYDQIYINQASTWTILKTPKQIGVGLEHGGYSGYGIALLPGRELLISLWGGGIVAGKINNAVAKLHGVQKYNTPRFGGDSNLSGSSNEKIFNELVLVSSDKRHNGVIFGASKQDIYASVNKGATWQKVLSIPFRIPRRGLFEYR